MWPFNKGKGRKEESQDAHNANQDEIESPRCPSHHYALAHIVLKDFCLGNPKAFFGLMISSEKEKFLEDLWAEVCRVCDAGGQPQFRIQDAQFVTTRIQDFPMVLVFFPPPSAMTEVFMVAVVLKVPVERLDSAPDNPEVRYFTLELGFEDDHSPRTVLCEWDVSGSHVNYDNGPELTPQQTPQGLCEEFIGSITKLL
jgi:hypothetical protein